MRIIVAFAKLDDAKNLKNVLNRNGFDDILACNSASQVIGAANEADAGVVICGYRLTDMHYSELFGYLPREFSMLLIAGPAKIQDCYSRDIVCLSTPLHTREFISTIHMMTMDLKKEMTRRKKRLPKRRTEEEQKTIEMAKALLMERNQMTEDEAHKYIQKLSMDSGNNLVETAEMVLAFE